MADQIRGLAALKTLFADNVSGDISPQDLRDFLVSITPATAEIYEAGNATATTISDTTSFHEISSPGATLTSISQRLGANDFDQPTAVRLRYLDTVTERFLITGHLSYTTASNNQEIHFEIGKNGTASAETDARNKKSGSDIQSISVQWITELAQNDYISFMVKNVSSATNITIVSWNIMAISLLE